MMETDFGFLMSLPINVIRANEYQGEIYHYTSSNGFNSILFDDTEKITLWASRYDCLNDESEGKIVRDIYDEVCEEMKNNQELSEELYDVLTSIQYTEKILFMPYVDGVFHPSKKECNVENKERERKNQYTLGYQFLTLNEMQAQLLYSLKAISVNYDIENTKDKKKQAIKKIWLEEWKKRH